MRGEGVGAGRGRVGPSSEPEEAVGAAPHFRAPCAGAVL